jgi:tetratricopeptide (TPR) repeat protein
MTKHFLLFFAFVFFTLTAAFSNNDELASGWTSFLTNDYTQARIHFNNAVNDPASAAEAHLGLSLMARVDKTHKEAFDHFKKFYELEENGDPYLFALWYSENVNNGLSGKKSESQIEMLENILNSPESNETMKASACFVLGSHYKAINKQSIADEYFEKIGAIMEWQAVGEFYNVSGSGFDKDYEPVKFGQPDHVFTNDIGAEIKWFDAKTTKPGRWIQNPHRFFVENSIIFVQTFCNSPSEQEVVIKLGTSGSVKFWINDHLLFSEAEERNNGMDTYSFTAMLKEGNNRMLIQLGSSEINRSNYLLRITDQNGLNISNLNFSTEYKAYPTDYNYESKHIPLFAEAYFEEKIQEQPDKVIYQLMLAETYLRNDKSFQARKILSKLNDENPDCGYVLMRLIEIYQREDNDTELSATLDKLKSIDPDNPVSLMLLYNDAIEEEDYKKAKSLLSDYEGAKGKDSFYHRERIMIASYEEQYEEMIDYINNAYNSDPNNSSFVLMKFYIDDAMKRTTNPSSILKKFLKSNYSPEVAIKLATHYFESGMASKGQGLFDEVIEKNPTAVGYISDLAALYSQIGNYSEAINNYRECLEIAPYVANIFDKLGSAYEQQGLKEKAIEAYENSIKYYPQNYQTRASLRRLNDDPDIFDSFEKPDVYELFKKSPDASDYPGENCIILLDEVQTYVYPEGGMEEKNFVMIKIFDATGIDTWKQYNLPSYSDQVIKLEKAEVIKSSGGKIKAQVNNEQVVFESLEVGDGILLIYKTEYYHTSKMLQHFYGTHYFNYFFPSSISRYSLMTPKNTDFKYNVRNSDLEPIITEKGNYNLYTWERLNNEVIKYESYMPSMGDYGEVLTFSTFPDWQFISDWYYDIYRTKSKPDFEVQELAATLFEGKEELSDYEKVREIYYYIVKNVRYSSVSFLQSGLVPQKSSEVINRRIGDCKDVATLFVSLCREIGIDASVVLVNTRDNGMNDFTIPIIEFNHAISKVTIDEVPYYIELTQDYSPFSTFSYYLKNSFCLDVEKNNTGVEPVLLNPESKLVNSTYRTGTISFDETKMNITKQNYRIGYNAAGMRSGYRDLSEEDRFDDIQQAISLNYPKVKLREINFNESLFDTSDTLSYTFSYDVENPFMKISDLYLMKLPFEYRQESADFLNEANRKYAIEIGSYFMFDENSESVVLEIPADKVLAETPDDVHLECENAKYSKTFKVEGNDLHIIRSFVITDDYVETDQYPAFKTFIEDVVESDSQQLAFKLK